ncbi:MAG: hypothetical protein FWG02_09230 [Holophagaceae bacterium]|nr:hypothetical protein [Holophagaceae bacterium]
MGNGQLATALPEPIVAGTSYGADVAEGTVATAPLYGRLPGPAEALEAIRLGEEDIKAGRVVPVEEMIAELERILAEGV